jgi:single-strand DNA-binding protein
MQQIIFTGNLGKDPEVKEFENGGSVANFTVGVTERGYKTKDGKEIPDHTEWFNCVAKNGLAKIVKQFLKKGNKVLVVGKMKTREYEKDGQKKYITEVIADNLELLTPKGEGSTTAQSTQSQPNPIPEEDDNTGLPF